VLLELSRTALGAALGSRSSTSIHVELDFVRRRALELDRPEPGRRRARPGPSSPATKRGARKMSRDRPLLLRARRASSVSWRIPTLSSAADANRRRGALLGAECDLMAGGKEVQPP